MKINAKLCLVKSLIALQALAACGKEEDENQRSFTFDANASAGQEIDHVVEPPQEYYDALMREELSLLSEPVAVTRPVLYLEFNGTKVPKGYNTGQSFIVCSREANIPSANFAETKKQDIIQRVQTFYAKAGSNLLITDKKPTARPYTTMVVGGSYRDLGCAERKGILGVAPLDRGNANKNDIGFTFTKYYNDARTVAETIAHEAGHSFGLDHVKERYGLMYYSSSSAIIGFIVGTVGAGRKQDEPKILQRDVGKGDASEPELEDGQDQEEDEEETDEGGINPPIPGNGGLNIPALGGLGDLLEGIKGGQGFPGGSLGGLNGSLGTIFAGIIPSGGNLGGIGGLSGLQDIFGILQSSGGGLLGNLGNTSGLPGIKDFPSLLGLQSMGSIPELMNSLTSCKQFVAQNYSGRTRESLNSFLKVSYAQAYQNLRK